MTYIDPGSGSMAFQFIVAGALGFLLTFWRKISGTVRSLFHRQAK